VRRRQRLHVDRPGGPAARIDEADVAVPRADQCQQAAADRTLVGVHHRQHGGGERRVDRIAAAATKAASVKVPAGALVKGGHSSPI